VKVFIVEQRSEEVQGLIDLIATTGKQKYVDLLKTKYGIDYEDSDQSHIDNASLNNIKNKEDFNSYEKYKEYARKIFKLRNIPLPKEKDLKLSKTSIERLSKIIGFKIKYVPYSGSGNYANVATNTMTIPHDNISANIFIHELGHIYDHLFLKNYEGIAKNSSYAVSSYEIGNAGEVFAENFRYFFLHPQILKKHLPEVYVEMNNIIDHTSKIKKFIYKNLLPL
jgi:hypothetical protein